MGFLLSSTRFGPKRCYVALVNIVYAYTISIPSIFEMQILLFTNSWTASIMFAIMFTLTVSCYWIFMYNNKLFVSAQAQFVAIMVHAFQLLFIDCNYPRAFVWWIGMHAVMFFFLFKEFYNQSYSRAQKVINNRLLFIHYYNIQSNVTNEVPVQLEHHVWLTTDVRSWQRILGLALNCNRLKARVEEKFQEVRHSQLIDCTHSC